MKLWMLIYFAGKLGAIIGPLPYDISECNSRRDRYQTEINAELQSRSIVVEGKRLVAGDVVVKCEPSSARPVLN